MRVLYVNHTALVSGGERSLATLLEALPADVEPVLACPAGELADRMQALGVPVKPIPGTAGSLRLDPVHSMRAVIDMARSAMAVRTVAKQAQADVVHANSIRAGLIATAAARLGGSPVVTHVRDRLPRGHASDISLRAIMTGSRVVIANSAFTASRFRSDEGKVRVIPSAVDLARFNPAAADGKAVRAADGIDPSASVISVIGQLTPWKGQDLAIRVAAALVGTNPDVQLLLIGSAKFTRPATRHDNLAYEARLRRLVVELDVANCVHFLGEREDVPDLLAATDILLAPSHEEPFGRSIVEAMAMRVPVIATEIGGPAETIRSGVDGILLSPFRPEPWIAAVQALIADPARRAKLGERGRERAVTCFSVNRHVSEVLRAYAAAADH